MELKLREFILNNENWEKLLSQPPYSLKIKMSGNLILFKYDQLNSDFSLPEVQESRGIIIDKTTLNVVRMAFSKFFNYGEPHAHSIDWKTARVQEKIDGSLMSVSPINENEWLISTNSNIDASSVIINSVSLDNEGKEEETFKDVFLRIAKAKGLDFSNLDRGYCYTFELVGPKNKIVIDYPEDIYHIGTRRLSDLQEVDLDIGIQKPKEYPIYSLEDCLNAVKALGRDKEGFVVVDANWNRVKIKSPAYLVAHHTLGGGNLSIKSLLRIWKAGEEDEILAYFPEKKVWFTKLDFIIGQICDEMRDASLVENFTLNNRDFYEYVKDKKWYPYLMLLKKNPDATPIKWLMGYTYEDDKGIHNVKGWSGLLDEVKNRWNMYT